MKQVRFTRSARKRRIGKVHVIAAMQNAGEPLPLPPEAGLDQRLLWIGKDDRGVVLEIIGIEMPDHLLVIHVMPYAYRRN